MLRKTTALTGCLLLTLLALIACGGGEEAEDLARQQEREEEWAWLQQSKQDLDAARQRVAEVHDQLAAAAREDSEVELGEEEVAALEAEAQELGAKIEADAEAFLTRLIAFINAAEIEVGEEMGERVKGAIRMKSDEDMLVAMEYIEKGGDYSRALDIYQAALQVDPDNEKLQAAIAEAEANRYMTEERFAQVKKGMTQDEVREVIGQPNLRNIQEYPDKKTVAWFYPKGPDRSAAGVYFQQRREGPYKVYLADFDAVKSPSAEVGGPGE